jgi:hypothetical protein
MNKPPTFKGDWLPSTNYLMELTLRDYFAAQAMNGMITHFGFETYNQDPLRVARWAYDQADAMMKARGEPEKQEPVGFNGLTESETAETMAVRGLSRRTWVGLTDDEQWEATKLSEPNPYSFARAVEAMLKEKNT